MKIGYFGDGVWAHQAFKKIVSDSSLQIVFVVLRYECQDMVLREMAEHLGIPVLVNPDVNSDNFIEVIDKYNADIFVSMSFNQIFRLRTINMPSMRTINCHAGKLPFYRGRNILNWVLINDEKEFGITVHYMDEKIDTGDIVLQRTFPITDTDDYGTLLEKAHYECANVLYDAIKKIQTGTSVLIPQNTIDCVGIYCGKRSPGDEVINWNQCSRQIFNFVRALVKPGPIATTYLNGCEVKISKTEMIPGAHNYINTVGQVVGKDERGFIVKTSDTIIRVTDYQCEHKIRLGDRLGE